MVLALVVDVSNRSRHVGRADAERAVSFLPDEILFATLLIHPSRRICLQLLHCNRQGKRGWQPKQEMHVVLCATDGVGLKPDVLRDAPQVCPEFRLRGGCN